MCRCTFPTGTHITVSRGEDSALAPRDLRCLIDNPVRVWRYLLDTCQAAYPFPPRRASARKRGRRKRYATPLPLAPQDDSHRTRSMEPHATPLTPARYAGSVRVIGEMLGWRPKVRTAPPFDPRPFSVERNSRRTTQPPPLASRSRTRA